MHTSRPGTSRVAVRVLDTCARSSWPADQPTLKARPDPSVRKAPPASDLPMLIGCWACPSSGVAWTNSFIPPNVDGCGQELDLDLMVVEGSHDLGRLSTVASLSPRPSRAQYIAWQHQRDYVAGHGRRSQPMRCRAACDLRLLDSRQRKHEAYDQELISSSTGAGACPRIVVTSLSGTGHASPHKPTQAHTLGRAHSQRRISSAPSRPRNHALAMRSMHAVRLSGCLVLPGYPRTQKPEARERRGGSECRDRVWELLEQDRPSRPH